MFEAYITNTALYPMMGIEAVSYTHLDQVNIFCAYSCILYRLIGGIHCQIFHFTLFYRNASFLNSCSRANPFITCV